MPGQSEAMPCSPGHSPEGFPSACRLSPSVTKFSFKVPHLSRACLPYSFSSVKPAVRWIWGAPESWSHLWSSWYARHNSLRTDHPSLCRCQLRALEHPPEEEDTAGKVGGERLGGAVTFLKWDLGCVDGLGWISTILTTRDQLRNRWTFASCQAVAVCIWYSPLGIC